MTFSAPVASIEGGSHVKRAWELHGALIRPDACRLYDGVGFREPVVVGEAQARHAYQMAWGSETIRA